MGAKSSSNGQLMKTSRDEDAMLALGAVLSYGPISLRLGNDPLSRDWLQVDKLTSPANA
jgi:hypothetical protein